MLKTHIQMFSRLLDYRFLLDYIPPKPVSNIVRNPSKVGKDIPAVVYQTWVSTKLGRTHWNAVQEFRDANKTFSFLILDDEAVDAYMERNWWDTDIYQKYKIAHSGPMKADIFILHQVILLVC